MHLLTHSSNLRNLDFKVRGRDGLLKQGQHRVGKVERLVTGIIGIIYGIPSSFIIGPRASYPKKVFTAFMQNSSLNCSSDGRSFNQKHAICYFVNVASQI